MRPSWPAPNTPTTTPRRNTNELRSARRGVGEHALGLSVAVAFDGCPDFGVFDAEDFGGEDCRIDGASAADRERSDGDARRHLRDREQRIEAVQRFALHWDAQ